MGSVMDEDQVDLEEAHVVMVGTTENMIDVDMVVVMVVDMVLLDHRAMVVMVVDMVHLDRHVAAAMMVDTVQFDHHAMEESLNVGEIILIVENVVGDMVEKMNILPEMAMDGVV